MGVALVAVVLTLALQVVRVLFPLAFRLSEDIGSVDAGLIVLAVFVLAPLLWYGVRRVASDRAVAVSVVVLAVARLALQTVHPIPVWLAMAAAGLAVAAVVAVVVTSVAGPPHRTVQALVLGMALDAAVRGVFRTWDPAWQAGVAPIAVAIGATAAAVWLAVRRPATAAPPPSPVGLLALGPYLFLHVLFVNAPAFVASQGDVGLALALTTILVADALAVLAAEAVARWRGAAFLSVGLIGVIALRTETGPQVLTMVGLAAIGTTAMLAFALRPARRRGELALAAGGAAASGLFLGLVLVYQLAYDLDLGFPNRFLLSTSALALLVLAFAARERSAVAVPPGGHWLAVPPIALLLVPAVVAISRGGGTEPQSPPHELRVMTYNLHLGVEVADGQIDLESLASVIDEVDPDVLVLQEVGRGWAVNGMTDLAEWLTWRLDTPYVWSPAADGQMGNAIFTRLSISASTTGRLPQAGGAMVRSELTVTVPTSAGDIRIVGTHLQHRDEDTPARLAEIEVLLDRLGTPEGTVVAGDLNAQPGSEELTTLEDFGLTSVQEVLGTDLVTSWRDGTIVDHVLVGPGVDAVEVEVPDRRSSDHLPLVATVRLE